MDNTFECPFCHEKHPNNGENVWFPCLGGFFLNWQKCNDYIQHHSEGNKGRKRYYWSVLGYHIAHKFGLKPYQHNLSGNKHRIIDFEKVLEENILPTPMEQVDNMILFIANHSAYLGHKLLLTPSLSYQLEAWIGVITDENFCAITETSQSLGFIKALIADSGVVVQIELLIDGWQHFRALQERNPESKQIFMAMEFNEEAKNFVNTHLKPLTKEMGFELKLLNEIINEKSLIDDKLRVEIKKSRLLICDLSHGNQGAYWESGYAEGLGIHVLYICHQNVLNSRSKAKRPHFDVNHQEIFTWADDESSIADFKEQLKAKIALLTQ